MRISLVALLALAAGSACAYRADPVPLAGPENAIAALAGEWVGEYGSRESGRSGSIYFRITAGSDVARGDVIMTPAVRERATAAFPPPADATVLNIAFVQVGKARVRGELVEYDDPGCGCRLTTTFEGTLDGNNITGTFTSVHRPGGLVQKGTWRATRR